MVQYVGCINDSPAFAGWLSGKVVDEVRNLKGIQDAYSTLGVEE